MRVALLKIAEEVCRVLRVAALDVHDPRHLEHLAQEGVGREVKRRSSVGCDDC